MDFFFVQIIRNIVVPVYSRFKGRRPLAFFGLKPANEKDINLLLQNSFL